MTVAHLGLYCREVGLDGLGLGDEYGVLLLVLRDGLLQAGDQLLHLFVLHTVVLSGMLQGSQLVAQWFNAVQHIRIVNLQRIRRDLLACWGGGYIQGIG